MLRTIFFDMGGTLDGDGHWLDRFVRLYRDHGFTLPREAIRRGFDEAERRAASDASIVSAGLETLVQRHLAWQFAAHGLRDDDAGASMVRGFVAGARHAAARNAAALAGLHRRGFALGVISNACGNAAALCDDLGFAPYLSAVIDSRIVGVAKPDPAIYVAALARLGADAATTMMVGDSYERDIVPPHHLGMQTRWVVHPLPPGGRGVAGGCIRDVGELAAQVAAEERTPA